MPFKGHITLDGKQYVLTRPPTKTLVNQMAPPIGQGESKYQDGTSWAAWVQKDWQEGNGRLDPLETQGFLYGEVESRVPKQLILPPKINVTDLRETDGTVSDARHVSDSATGYWTVLNDAEAAVRGIYIPFKTPATWNPNGTAPLRFWIYCTLPGGRISSEILSDNAGAPGSSISPASSTTSRTPFNSLDPQWYSLPHEGTDLAASTQYWLFVTSSLPTFRVYYSDSGYSVATWALGASAQATTKYAMFFSNIHGLGTNVTGIFDPDRTGSDFFRFNGSLYYYYSNKLFRYVPADDNWVSVGTVQDTAGDIPDITSAVPFGDTVYFSTTGVNGYGVMNESEVFDSFAPDGTLFANYDGYLWRAQGNALEYSRDGTTWEPTASYGLPMTVGSPEYTITGMAGLGRTMFVATERGLFRHVEGDFVVPVEEWGGIDIDNGKRMVSFQGALYIVAGGRVIRFTEDQRFQDVWMTSDDDIVSGRLGQVLSLGRMNNWLVAIVGGVDVQYNLPDVDGVPVSPVEYSTNPSAWILQGNSWHALATLPLFFNRSDYTITGVNHSIFYDRPSQHIWAATPDNILYKMYVPDFTLNPYNDRAVVFKPTGWVEWDWFDGNILEVLKDYESVTLIGENLNDTCFVEVFWKDDDSGSTWERLGTTTGNISELRWDIDRSDRPATRRFKMGMLFSTLFGTESPRIRAIRVKYLPMLRDWYTWNLSIDTSGTAAYPQEGIAGEVNTRTVEQINAEIEVIVKATGIFLYTDIDGQQYEVKIKSGAMPYTKMEHNDNTGEIEWEGAWNIMIEQTHPNPYEAP